MESLFCKRRIQLHFRVNSQRLKICLLTGTLIDRVAEIIHRYNMLAPGDRVGVAVSGGADSVVLLHILKALAPQFPIELSVLHVNHHLRGEESDGDEQFVRSLAASLNLECLVEQAPVKEGNLEAAARDARRAFFFRLLREERRIGRVALGHTLSDQAETVLFRLLRGSGLAGLAGMQISGDSGIIRPLLTTSREEVREFAQSEGWTWREDSSNADLRFSRNRLRKKVIPELAEHFNRNLEQTLAGTANLAGAEEDYWKKTIEPVYQEIAKRTFRGLILDVNSLRTLHLALQRRIVRRALLDLRGDLRGLDLEHVEAVLALCRGVQGHDRVLIPGADTLRSFDRLLLTRPGTLNAGPRHYRVELAEDGCYELPFHSGSLYVNRVNGKSPICANFKEDQELPLEIAFLDSEALARHGSLYVRNWEPGDELLRPGHKSAEKVKSLFQEYRVLLWERRHWPVVVSGDQLVWVRGVGAAAHFRASDQSREFVQLRYAADCTAE